MLVLLSPAKTLDYTESSVKATKNPKFKSDALELIDILKEKSIGDLMNLMSIKEKLGALNFERYQKFSKNYTVNNSKAALLAFKGDVYIGLDATTLTNDEILYSQDHIRILSGLYGLLSPLDKMQPYRLEMGTTLKTEKGTNLYHFWGDKITKEVNKQLKAQENAVLVNLASQEYFHAIKRDKIKGDIIDINFKEFRDGKLKFISFTAKKARGLMTRYIIQNKIETKEGLKGFNYENYFFDESLSDASQFTFVR
jgi:cytoplasmic iron level regulating protein YaaA (DUF328/UPF0246 family)